MKNIAEYNFRDYMHLAQKTTFIASFNIFGSIQLQSIALIPVIR